MCKSFEIALNESDLSASSSANGSASSWQDSPFAPVFSELLAFCSGKNSAIISLKGDLAAGKTTLARAISKQFCTSEATSPTYLKMSEHKMRANCELAGLSALYHYDFYAQMNADLQAALFEHILSPGLHVIEWLTPQMQQALKAYAIDVLEVYITASEADKSARIYTLRIL